MWRRLFSSNLKTLNTASHLRSAPSSAATFRFSPTTTTAPSSLNRFLTTQSDGSIKKSVEDVLPIATGHEREEIQAQLESVD
ncbi:hypothetical protein TanjilG_31160 [Lupinus angustifolius]|uniref:Uncharacterized protein n=1 Tax=Lupinus angustifolius TaxID=3871 RepID=A0A394DQU6_LUPAN|nr:hypothetical protein TanjilG_31160 [Lupinus angustifolius]